jgi:hypothetical protein
MMKTKNFNNIRSLDDIQKQKLRLNKKIRLIEKSLTHQTDLAKLFFNPKEGLSSLFGETDSKLGIIGYLLPLGIKYLTSLFKKNPDKKQIKRLITYSAIGSITAFLIYQYMKHRKSKTG